MTHMHSQRGRSDPQKRRYKPLRQLPSAIFNSFAARSVTICGLRYVLARHVKVASHMTEWFIRVTFENIRICVNASGPAGTDMITELYSIVDRFDPDFGNH